jgi:hypothetical protein
VRKIGCDYHFRRKSNASLAASWGKSEWHTSGKKLKNGGHAFRSRPGKKTGNLYYASNLEDIERNAQQESDEANWAWIKERQKEIRADAANLKRLQREAGLTAAEETLRAADETEQTALHALAELPATTVGGFVAALTYLQKHVRRGNELPNDLDDFLANTARTADRLLEGGVRS